MNTTLEEGVELANAVNALLEDHKANCEGDCVCAPSPTSRQYTQFSTRNL